MWDKIKELLEAKEHYGIAVIALGTAAVSFEALHRKLDHASANRGAPPPHHVPPVFVVIVDGFCSMKKHCQLL